jgi:deferrochelatase/peroxidase EfeB
MAKDGSRPGAVWVRTAAGLAAAAGTGLGMGGVSAAVVKAKHTNGSALSGESQIEPCWGAHQGGTTTPQQSHTYVAALDLVTTEPNDVERLLRIWTASAARMSHGQPAQPLGA